MRKLLLTTALVATLAQPAFAAVWTVNDSHSSLTFTGKQDDESFTGSFGKFASEIDFDEAAPEKGRIHITVDITSVTVEGKDRSEALPTDDWLGAAKFPKAEFTSKTITRTATHQYAATGTLSLHGITKQVTLPFTLTKEQNSTRAEGELLLNRSDYKIGGGRFADDKWVAYPVSVRYIIVATPK